MNNRTPPWPLACPRDTRGALDMALIDRVRHLAEMLHDSTPGHDRIFWRCLLCEALAACENYSGRRWYEIALAEARQVINRETGQPVRRNAA